MIAESHAGKWFGNIVLKRQLAFFVVSIVAISALCACVAVLGGYFATTQKAMEFVAATVLLIVTIGLCANVAGVLTIGSYPNSALRIALSRTIWRVAFFCCLIFAPSFAIAFVFGALAHFVVVPWFLLILALHYLVTAKNILPGAAWMKRGVPLVHAEWLGAQSLKLLHAKGGFDKASRLLRRETVFIRDSYLYLDEEQREIMSRTLFLWFVPALCFLRTQNEGGLVEDDIIEILKMGGPDNEYLPGEDEATEQLLRRAGEYLRFQSGLPLIAIICGTALEHILARPDDYKWEMKCFSAIISKGRESVAGLRARHPLYFRLITVWLFVYVSKDNELLRQGQQSLSGKWRSSDQTVLAHIVAGTESLWK